MPATPFRSHPTRPRPTLLASSWLGLAAILSAFLLLAVVYGVVNPIFEAPDEAPHFFTARHLAQGHGFAAPDPSKPWSQEASQPPLYYLAAAGVIAPIDTSDAESLLWFNRHAQTGFPGSLGNKNQFVHTDRQQWPYTGATLAVHVARLLSILLGALTVTLVYALGRTLAPAAPRIALAMAALTAFTPQFLFSSASVTNDNMINLTAALAAWLLLAGLRGPRPRGWPVLLGIALGLVGLSKVSGLLLWPLAGLVILVVAWRRKMLRRGLLDLVVVFACAGLVAGWWYVRSWLQTGDPTGVGSITTIMSTRSSPLTLDVLIGELRGLRFSYWGMFGWFNVPSPLWAYRLSNALTIVALLGLPFALAPRLTPGRGAGLRRADLPWLIVPAAWLGLVLLALLRYDLILPALQGRLLMPAGWVISLFLVLGWAGLVSLLGWLFRWLAAPLRQMAGALLGAAPLGLLAAWAVLAPIAVIGPAYPTPQVLDAGQVPAAARRDPVGFGPYAQFVGGEFRSDTVRPGEVLNTTAYWAVKQPFDKDYSVFVHVRAPDGQILAQDDSWPGQGGYPTRLWQPGQVVADVHEIAIPDSAAAIAPAVLPVVMGFYLAETGERLYGHDADGNLADASPGSVLLLPAQPLAVQPATPLAATFGEGIRLLGYTLSPGAVAQPGQPLQVTLYWQAAGPIAEDATVVLELRAADGKLDVVEVGRPRNGGWPTTAWEPGGTVEDVHQLDIPLNMPGGAAGLWLGLNGPNGTRLPVSGASGAVEGGRIHLQDVPVQP